MTDMQPLTLSLHWDIVFPDTVTAIILNSYKDHYWVRNLAPTTKKLLSAIQIGGYANQIIARLEKSAGRRLEEQRSFVEELHGLGILILTDPKKQSALTGEKWERYATLGNWLASRGDGIGPAEAVRMLTEARVAVVGVGGVGSLLAMNLASSAVGHLTLIDGDRVELSNLARQPVYRESDATHGRLKVSSLKREIRLRASGCHVSAIREHITCAEDAVRLLKDNDIVVCSADVPRIVVNRWISDACVLHRIPAIHTFMGQIGPLFVPGRSACFRCLEARWRRESGAEYDEIVSALSRLKTRRHPSMVAGPAEMAAILCREVVDYLTGTRQPQSIEGMLRLEENGRRLVRVSRKIGCSCMRS